MREKNNHRKTKAKQKTKNAYFSANRAPRINLNKYLE